MTRKRKATVARLDMDARYAVKGYPGIAFYISGFPRRWESWLSLGRCSDRDCECWTENGEMHEFDNGEGEWVPQDESCGRVLVVMVGDDRKHNVSVDDLTELAPGAFCHECGQVGCGWHTNEED